MIKMLGASVAGISWMIRLFRVFIPIGALTLLISEVLLVTIAYVISSYFVLEVNPEIYLFYDGGMVSIIIVVITIVLGLYFQDLYSNYFVKSKIVLLHQLC